MGDFRINRRRFLKVSSSGLLAGVLGCSLDVSAEKNRKPNIVFMMADDLGIHQVGAYGAKFYETPYIDKLAADGMKFTNAYAACTVCSPTRASIMTGKYPARLHLTSYIPGKHPKNRKLLVPEWNKKLDLEEITVAETLKSAGYATGHFGKWHLNYDKKYKLGRPGDPGSQGFDDVLTTHKPKAGPESKYPEDWHHTREITERSVAFIENNKDKPFFCYVSYNSIHGPLKEKESLIAKYSKRPGASAKGDLKPGQAAMLETLDNSVGAIADKINELGLERDTVMIFFSDNGQSGPKDIMPWRGSKGDLYEGGIRMPLIVKWPTQIKKRVVCDDVVISNDFFPTFNDIGGARSKAKDVDGISILPLLKNPNATLGRDAVYWHFPHYHGSGLGPQGAMRKGRYKLIEWFEKSRFNEDGAYELYDLVKDPDEQNDLAGEMGGLVEELKGQLHKWQKDVGAQVMPINDRYVEKKK